VALVETGLYTKLTATAGVTTLVSTRIYPLLAPDDATYPNVTYQKISAPRINTHDGPSGLAVCRFQINSWAVTTASKHGYQAAKEIADAIRVAIDGVSFAAWGTVVIQHCTLLDESDVFDPSPESEEIRVYGVRQDYEIWSEE